MKTKQQRDAEDKASHIEEEKIRDVFAAAAMQALIRGKENTIIYDDDIQKIADRLAIAAYILAKAMIEERAQQDFDSLNYE